ncbi:MAG: PilZ domain-containing protein [Candidatus Sulfotelmatobacter sp.]
MSEHVQLDGLLFTSDKQVVSVMNQILESFAIETEVCNELDSALDAVTHRRLDAVIVDWDGDFDPTRIVRATRKSSPNSNSTIVAMVNGRSETHALLVGANFMIHKPADVNYARRCMRAAYGTMLQNRRRAARVPVDIPVRARVAELGEVQARISDLSVGGLALQGGQPLPVNREVLTQFSLPGTSGMIHAAGRIVNANNSGRAGVRFSFIPEEDRNLLEGWLAIELAKLEKAEMPIGDGNNEGN